MKTQFCILILLLAAAVSGAQTNNLTSLLQQGLLEEEAVHDLNAAIADYQSLATQFDKDRQVAATAIYRLGECYRKLGQTNEAVSQYQRIVQEFPDQETLATLSRRNLTGLGRQDASSPPPPLANSEEDQEIRRIKQMIQNSPDLINPSSGGTSAPLCAAAEKGQLRVAAFLLANGADVNLNNPLYYAAKFGQNAMVKLLLDHNAAVDAGDGEPTALQIAAEKGYRTVAETLLAYHAKVNAQGGRGRSPLGIATAYNHLAMVQLLFAHGADPNAGKVDAPLLCAINIRDAALAELLLQAGANPNKKGVVDWSVSVVNDTSVTPLFLAISTKQLQMVQLLLKFKADPNDSQTYGPVLFKALSDTNILETLLNAGAKVDAPETLNYNGEIVKRTALDNAANENNADAVEILLKHGANPNTQDERGDAALHWAALSRPADEKVFKLLLDYKADPNVRDNGNKTPLELLKEKLRGGPSAPEQKNQIEQAVDLLRRHGAVDKP